MWILAHGIVVRLLDWLAIPHGMTRQLSATVPSLAALVVLFTLLIRRAQHLTLPAAFATLGLGRARHGLRQVVVALVATIPIALVLAAPAGWIGGRWMFRPDALELLPHLVLGVAVMEELTFRGFLFSRLRVIVNFRVATVWSAVLFGATHGIPLFAGLESGAIRGPHAPLIVFLGLLVPMLFSVPVSRMFERAGGSLWGPVIAHLGFDLANLFAWKPGTMTSSTFMLLAQAASLVILMLGTRPAARGRRAR